MNRLLILIFVLLIILWLIFSAAAIIFPENPGLIFISKITCSYTCHQISDRCFSYSDIKMNICARCTGIYTGFILTGLYFLFYTISNKFLKLSMIFLFSLPLIIELMIEKIFGYNSGNTLRFMTGLIFSIPVSMHFYNSLLKLKLKNK